MSFSKKGFKYFIEYKDDEKVRPLHIMFPKMSGYAKSFDEAKCMCFLIKDDGFFLKKCNKIWDKVSNSNN